MQTTDENRHVTLESDRPDRDSQERKIARNDWILLLFKIAEVLGREFALIDLKQLDQNPIRSRNHNIFPESQVRNALFDDNPSGSEIANHFFNIIGLDSKMVNAPSPGGPGWLIVEVKPAAADSHEYVSRAGQLLVENHPAPEEFFVERDALLNIRGKNMNVMNMTNQLQTPPFSQTHLTFSS